MGISPHGRGGGGDRQIQIPNYLEFEILQRKLIDIEAAGHAAACMTAAVATGR
jgi:hypothetical protein